MSPDPQSLPSTPGAATVSVESSSVAKSSSLAPESPLPKGTTVGSGQILKSGRTKQSASTATTPVPALDVAVGADRPGHHDPWRSQPDGASTAFAAGTGEPGSAAGQAGPGLDRAADANVITGDQLQRPGARTAPVGAAIRTRRTGTASGSTDHDSRGSVDEAATAAAPATD